MPKTKPNKLDNLEGARHSLAHLLAAAVMELYPKTKRAIGPAIENGFYFDFEFAESISDADLPKIEKRMREIMPTWDRFSKHLLDAKSAKKEYPANPYKHEMIEEFSKKGKKKVSFYKSGSYWDLCRGGHAESMKEIDSAAFKLDRVAGAYWRGDEKNKMLTRIYGLAFATKRELDEHMAMLAEAKRRDHKKLGPDLDLFTFSDLVGSGLPLWTPKGTILRNTLDEFVWQLRRARGYERVEIPHITKKDLYQVSGHWDKFKDELFRVKTREGHEFAMKPMNCPHHIQIFLRKKWSYRELPQRYATTTACYRDEQTGELSGLSRVRAFWQDDAHVFCRKSQVREEFLKIWDIVHEFYAAIGFKLKVRVSLHDPKHPEKYLGNPASWRFAEGALRQIARDKKADGWEAEGEAAFYGPKLDFMAKDSLGREWQVATIQLDVNMPERFKLACVGENGKEEGIVMIHAAIMGSLERFISVAIEHFAGAFPVWLAPVQAAVLPVGEKFSDYAAKIAGELRAKNIRVEARDANESLGKRIRQAEMEKIPYVLVVGEKEEQAKSVNVRHYKLGQVGEMKSAKLAERIQKEYLEKTI